MRAYLRLIRLPNVFSVLADAVAGHLLASYAFKIEPSWRTLALSCCASASLYLAGMAFNDIADLREDSQVRPTRPIPSGAVSLRGAWICAIVLMLCGIGIAASLSRAALIFSVCTALAIFLYDFVAKGRFIFGPLALGLCRGFNMLMVIAAVSGFEAAWGTTPFYVSPWTAAWASALYGAAVTAFSAREETGRGKGALVMGWLFFLPASFFASCVVVGQPQAEFSNLVRMGGVLIAAILLVRLFKLTNRSAKEQSLEAARALVLAGVQGFCLLDAAMVLQGVHYPIQLWGFALVLFMYPGRFLRGWLEQREA